jgi:hypothetical protein
VRDGELESRKRALPRIFELFTQPDPGAAKRSMSARKKKLPGRSMAERYPTGPETYIGMENASERLQVALALSYRQQPSNEWLNRRAPWRLPLLVLDLPN